MTTVVATCEEAVRTPSRMPFAAVAALMLLAASSACAPRPVNCPPPPDRFDSTRGFTREKYKQEVHPAMAATAVVLAAASMLAGHRCD